MQVKLSFAKVQLVHYFPTSHAKDHGTDQSVLRHITYAIEAAQ